jgi:hypothetical protein
MPTFSGAAVTGSLSIENSDGVTIYEKTVWRRMKIMSD